MNTWSKLKLINKVVVILPGMNTVAAIFLFVPEIAVSDAITLQSALEHSLKHNFDIRIAKNQDQKVQNNKILGTGSMLPTVDAIARSSYSGTEGDVSTTSDNLEAGLEASWTVFDGFFMFHNKESLVQKAEFSSLEYRGQVELITVDVMQAYFNCVTQTNLLQTSNDQVKISRERLDKINFKKNLGTSSTSEQLNAKVALNEDLSVVQNRQLQKIIALNSLKLLMGLRVVDSIEVEQKFNLPPIKMGRESWLEKAEKKNANLNMHQKLKRIEELNLSMARALYWPTIVVTGTVGYGESRREFSNNQVNENRGTNYSMGVSARYPIFAGFKNVTALKNLKLNKKNQDLLLKEYQYELESLVYQQWAILQNTYQQVLFELDAVDLANENLSISQQQLNLGNIEGVAFREAQLSLIKALTRLATSKFEARLAMIELERLAGEIRVE